MEAALDALAWQCDPRSLDGTGEEVELDLDHAESLALALMRHHGLFTPARRAWRLRWSRSVSAFGQCVPGVREIRLSRPMVERNPVWAVLDCILHEIAHALTPRAGHGPAWRRAARKLGCDAQRCYAGDEVVTIPRRYLYSCGCGRSYPRHRRSLERRRCGRCGQPFRCVDRAGDDPRAGDDARADDGTRRPRR